MIIPAERKSTPVNQYCPTPPRLHICMLDGILKALQQRSSEVIVIVGPVYMVDFGFGDDDVDVVDKTSTMSWVMAKNG